MLVPVVEDMLMGMQSEGRDGGRGQAQLSEHPRDGSRNRQPPRGQSGQERQKTLQKGCPTRKRQAPRKEVVTKRKRRRAG